jgi:hypothetical protein
VSARDPFKDLTISDRLGSISSAGVSFDRAVRAAVEFERAMMKVSETVGGPEPDKPSEIKIGYTTTDGRESKAYVSEPDVYGFATGTNKYTDEDVKVWWTGSNWVEVEDIESETS